MAGWGFPTTCGAFPDAARTAATMVPVAGAGPSGVGKTSDF